MHLFIYFYDAKALKQEIVTGLQCQLHIKCTVYAMEKALLPEGQRQYKTGMLYLPCLLHFRQCSKLKAEVTQLSGIFTSHIYILHYKLIGSSEIPCSFRGYNLSGFYSWSHVNNVLIPFLVLYENKRRREIYSVNCRQQKAYGNFVKRGPGLLCVN